MQQHRFPRRKIKIRENETTKVQSAQTFEKLSTDSGTEDQEQEIPNPITMAIGHKHSRVKVQSTLWCPTAARQTAVLLHVQEGHWMLSVLFQKLNPKPTYYYAVLLEISYEMGNRATPNIYIDIYIYVCVYVYIIIQNVLYITYIICITYI